MTLRQFFSAAGTMTVALALVAVSTLGCGQSATTRGETSGAGGSGGDGAGGSGGSDVKPNDPLPLKVLTWNVHNLVNDKNDSSAPFEPFVSATEYATHRKAVAAVLATMDADVVVLQEVENENVLKDLNDTELGGKYMAIGLIDGNDPRGIDIAVLSKIPIDSIVTHQDDSFPLNGTQGPNYSFSRDCPEIHINFNGRSMVFLGAHLKAKQDDDPVKRLAEAQQTRAIANGLAKADPSRAILILGDFNDTPDSAPYLAIRGEGANQYADAAQFVPAADRWSYDYQGKLELIDYQMSSPVLSPMLDSSSVVIRHGNDVDDASDHAPVMATYSVN